jgi:glycosyltransferase EpsD
MNKILFVANIHKHIKAFHIPYIQYLQRLGYEVHVAANDPDTIISQADKQYNLPINRFPFSRSNIDAIKQLREIIEKEDYCLIHCHTAMGSVVARMAAREYRRRGKLKVLYTVHGFHFYKGSPKLYWLLYYPMEVFLSKFTDGIITINKEDFDLVSDKKFAVKRVFNLPGVGINTRKFLGLSLDQKEVLREKLGYSSTTLIIIYVAEFIERKNHKFLLACVPMLREVLDDFKIILAGRGSLRTDVEKYAHELQVNDKVDFLGFRSDIGELIIMSDIGVSVSTQEGLPMNIAEEMYAGKPVVASKIRGHIDLIDDGETGFLFDSGDKSGFVERIFKLCAEPNLYNRMSENAQRKAKLFELDNCMEQMKVVYSELLPK